ncbi:MAG: AmmeMemoRadiSam system radical SAM enzyme [Bacteroidetes bacterium]|jgi:pyruvate formate lyase activating enzyme|nr:AmmeMemoRadiSam system radical SAM enzyme [Bacteroidota bacterium]MBT3748148.1 AmmeMemoRadiSam system radical SAM enzyme [Bacteroidota bacterium]MBT4401583.1 AmmeMemoRadiSam system radical SAM enzyme [Bacteroidota bacterium]MBT4408903.1 AmmeMemoRadiSam system radical SAM enzyme [Bacteroidota bacterium]MBT7095451.1 AmmeMemoRadiSam system radical SAM enzyme [Bacteroidota bacterium]
MKPLFLANKMNKREFIKKTALGSASTLFWPLTSSPCLKVNLTDTKFMQEITYKEAVHVIETPKGLRCLICPNECTLKEGETSDCHNRKVIRGKLYTLAYGNACAINIDPVEKKPLLHFKPGMPTFSFGTAGCNFSCLNCQNWEISQVSPEDIRSYKATPQALVDAAIKQECSAIAYTYNEPTSYFEYMFETAKLARKAGLHNLMISNGYINPKPLMEIIPYLDAANIDLKVFDDTTYQQLSSGKLKPVLDSLQTLKKHNIWLEITNLIVPQWTDDMEYIDKMCKWLVKKGFENTPLHFSRFHPAHKLLHVRSTPLKTLLEARKIAKSRGVNYVYIGNVPEIDGESTFCSNCNKLLIQRKGYEIKANYIQGSICPECEHSIPGVWS